MDCRGPGTGNQVVPTLGVSCQAQEDQIYSVWPTSLLSHGTGQEACPDQRQEQQLTARRIATLPTTHGQHWLVAESERLGAERVQR